MAKLENNPLFLGLTHIGQVYSSSWAKKIGPCSIYDFNKEALKNFKHKKFTQEEPNIKNLRNKKITFLNNENVINGWDCRMENGNFLSSGIYFVASSHPEEGNRVGKLAVIRK